MGLELPIPVDVALPNKRWYSVDSKEVGAGDAAFTAVRVDPNDMSYTPVMSVRGSFRVDASTLGMVADETLQSLRQSSSVADLVKRTEIESSGAPAIVQLIEMDATIDGSRFDLYQAQVLQAIVDSESPWKRIILVFAVTCKFAQWPVVGSEFRDFVAEARIVPGADEMLAAERG